MAVARVAVAYSGGRDSTALLHATVAMAAGCGVEVIALHVHHGLSPQADRWLAHCAARCRRWQALGLVDRIVAEPVGGAHRDTKQMAAYLKRALNDALRQVADLKPKELLERRYQRLQAYGRFTDTTAPPSTDRAIR